MNARIYLIINNTLQVCKTLYFHTLNKLNPTRCLLNILALDSPSTIPTISLNQTIKITSHFKLNKVTLNALNDTPTETLIPERNLNLLDSPKLIITRLPLTLQELKNIYLTDYNHLILCF